MEELVNLLNKVEDAYFDFVIAMVKYAEKKQSRKEALVQYLKNHSDATSSDVIEFVSEQADFYEDAAYSKVREYEAV